MNVTSAFQGITTPLSDLYQEIFARGWKVNKVDTRDGQFVAIASNPHGDQVEKTGRDANTALANVLTHIVRKEFIRQGAWTNHWADQLEPIAQAYARAPHFDPAAAGAWHELGTDSMQRAEALSQQLDVEIVDDPHPYTSPQEMWKDVEKNKHILVSRADANMHPLWTEDQVVAYRLTHDVLGHAAAGGDFGWTGENLATAAHMPYLSPSAQQALFTEAIGSSAYKNYYQGWGPPKITFLNQHLEAVQDEQNKPGHGGLPPEASLSPGALPQRTGGVRRDPNYGYDAGVVPPSVNAVTAFGDPLDSVGTKDMAHKLNTNWQNWQDPSGKPDFERMKQAVVNAMRAALLSPKTPLKWNAAHYQNLQHIPYHHSDPKTYWDALETSRIEHNRAQGIPNPETAHKAHYQSLLDFYRYYSKHHPHMDMDEVKEHADREVQIMQAEIEERLFHESKDPQMDILEPKIFKQLDRRLKAIIKDDKSQVLAGMNDYNMPERYGAFMGQNLIAIARVARKADVITEAALEDMRNHDGAGHMFRQTLLSLGIPYVGPKVASFAWLLLAPMTSQLATVDTHMMDMLGYNHKKDMNDRDYFRMERELQAGRDAAGYNHMPLGQFQWALWDHKRTGPGTHQDHSSLRPWEPTPHHLVEWGPTTFPKTPGAKQEYIPPDWWQLTEPHRQNEVAKWNTDVAQYYPQNRIPWQDLPAEVPDEQLS